MGKGESDLSQAQGSNHSVDEAKAIGEVKVVTEGERSNCQEASGEEIVGTEEVE